ncbi:5-hydroxytryptamine receptor 1-like [Frankliniella occidentalis]|uniref:5-hydroxytryptamine receptor 1-like n=1 Tax=Frankliniella occidentalis TaxID=133901 RepID=A0A9C6U267_FRAOC|nr:5-hydroxytryptamine receptor 1-like [Frankliniella occidentalis]XP_052126120.1 5-hydroxytryptamine receptor 1-like [Frankliniella occidentalis]
MEASADSLSSTLLLIEPVSSNASLLDLDNASHIGGPSLGYGYAQGFAPLPGSSPAPVDPPWGTWFPGPDSPYSAGQAVVIALVLLCVVVVTFVGNILVCVAVCLVRKLRRPCNYLLVSLAVSDICVAVLVMPMALLYEVFGRWDFGRVMCDLWVSFDVLSCTASILNLCMISVDRYYAITKPLEYGVKRTPRRMVGCVSLVWLMAACISLPPLLILGNEHDPPDGKGPPQCTVCQNFGYQIYATLWSFYIPLTVMIVVYYKIFRAARRIVLEERRAQTHLGPPGGYLQPPPHNAAACCTYHHNNLGPAAPAADREDRAAAGGGAGGGGGGGGGGGAPGVKNGGTSPDVILANNSSSLLLTTPTGVNSSAPNASPGSSPAASTPAASGRQHRPSTTSTNTTCSGQLGSSRCLATSDAGRRSDESQCPMLGPPPRSRSRSPRGGGGGGGGSNGKRRGTKKKKGVTSVLVSGLGSSSPHKARHSSACSAATVGVSTHTRKLRFLAKERKASTTLGIIMSAFIFCWLPFFVLALVRPFLRDQSTIPASVTSLFLWLGYANSLLNPIIYATLNRDFRRPFQQILYFRCGSLNHMMREEFYQSQYGDPEPAQNYYHVAPQQQYCVIGHVTPPSGTPGPGGGRAEHTSDLGPSEDEAEDDLLFRSSGQGSPGAVITAAGHIADNADESFL